MKSVALYARVSTALKTVKNPDGTVTLLKSQDPENQLRELRAECARLGYSPDQIVEYVDRETGTGKRRREHFERMLSDAERRRGFDLLLIWAIDRLSREGTLKTMLIINRLTSYGVKVKSLREPWLEPSSPTYELLLPIFSWAARAESQRLSTRIKAGLARAVALDGRRLGRPPVDVEVDKVRAAYAQHQSIRTVSRLFGIGRSTVHRLIRQHTPESPDGQAPPFDQPRLESPT